MRLDAFRRRLMSGKGVHYTYKRDAIVGLVKILKYQDQFILTWEECRDGDQYNEHLYTRDERHKFSTLEEVEKHLDQNGLSNEHFLP
jgi:hypothetical protein